jgi:hypothetical protein
MNSLDLRGCFRISRLAAGLLGNVLACALGMALAGPACALVGPAREAPEFVPYIVMVMTRSGGGANFCTASVIAQDVVLTAAHCVTDIADTQVFFWASEGKLTFFDVMSIAKNPGFKPGAGRKHQISIDLALVRLAQPLPSSFKPVELAQLDHVTNGQPFRIIGFGRASEKVSGTSGVLRSGILVASGPRSPLLTWLVDPNRTGLGGCTGDSGAPVLTLDRPALVAVAIRAKGSDGYSCGAVTEAVLIGPQLPWLRAALRSW